MSQTLKWSSVTTPANLQLTVTCDGFEMPDN